ncbi:MAG: response regulator [Verrucomicrobiia bacterium]|jgi:DNA-binding response OmpR family regulator
MKILIADDEPMFLTVLKTSLDKLGYTVFSAPDGRQAFELWKKEETPIVITDWLMPDMTGIELCAAIRKEKRDFYTYIIILTGLDTRDAYIKGLEEGADDFMVKPFEEAMLGAKLKVAERIINLNTRVDNLEKLLPICSWCKKIRVEESQWMPLESYLKARSKAKISHTICPECSKKYFNSDVLL